MTYPCHVSLAGCRTAAEAEQRLRAWLEQIHADASPIVLTPTLNTDCCGAVIPPDT